jgi:hypothetical protein
LAAKKSRSGGDEFATIERWPDALGELCTPVSLTVSTDQRSGSEPAATSPVFSDAWNVRTAGNSPKLWVRWDPKGRSAS